MRRLRLFQDTIPTPGFAGPGFRRTVSFAGLTGAFIGASLLAGCPPKGSVAALNITPRMPVVGAKLTIVLDRDPRGHFPTQDGLYSVVISRPLEITPENPTPSQPPDAGFKLGDMVFVNGHGEFQTVLQPTYGPNKYGTILTLAPGTQLNLSVSGHSFTRGTSLIIGADSEPVIAFRSHYRRSRDLGTITFWEPMSPACVFAAVPRKYRPAAGWY